MNINIRTHKRVLFRSQFAGGRPEPRGDVAEPPLQPHPQDRGPGLGLAPAPLGPLLQQDRPDPGSEHSDLTQDFKFILQPNN